MLAGLERLSAAIGRDPEQVQAAGGNTSLKDGEVLWVKASGMWLGDAAERDVFVPVRLPAVRRGIERRDADPVSAAVIAERNARGLRPSIETTLHALLPHRVVVHTHSVRAIAFAIRDAAEDLIAARLDGLAWCFVAYRHPGLPLTQGLEARLRAGPADVVVLGNHGLVVGGDTVEAAGGLLAEVERRLEVPARTASVAAAAGLERLASDLGLRLAKHAGSHALAADSQAIAWATAGSLYPDHVIFLGPAAASLTGDASQMGQAIEAARARGRHLFIVPGQGVLLERTSTRSADELALCLALVLARVPAGASARCLTADDEAALLDWDAEQYRQSLDAGRRP